MTKINIDQLEARLKTLIEVDLSRVLTGSSPEDRIAQRLASLIRENIKQTKDGPFAPNAYVLVAHPVTLARWRNDNSLLERMSSAIEIAGKEMGYKFLLTPGITTAVDTTLPEGEIKLLASFSGESIAETVGLPDENSNSPVLDTIPGNAFLILHGTKIIPLLKPVINIGRRLDNHIVIDDPRISRNHAQLRVVKGRFVIFDLSSTGGTYVNGQRINQSVLYPGDVVSLAGVSLIYGQENTTAERSQDETPPDDDQTASDRPTAIIKPENEN